MKRPDLPYLVFRRAKGRSYWYFERLGSRVRLPDPSDPTFLSEYEQARRGRAATPSRRTWRALIEFYRQSTAWTDKAARTQKDYSLVLDWIGSTMGDLDPAAIQTPHIVRMRDEQGRERRRFANYIVQVMRVLLGFARENGWVTVNAAEGVKLLAKPRSEADLHRPWTTKELEKVCAAAAPGTAARTIVELELGLGQRTGDVIRLDWSMWQDSHFVIRQSKTGRVQHLHVTERLASYLDGIKQDGGPILRNSRTGRPLTYSGAYQQVRPILKDVGMPHLTLHGLRYTAAAELGAAGVDDEGIAAVTGHATTEMVRKYAGVARQKARSESAQKARSNKPRTEQETLKPA